ncbi:hypothetical protein V6N12_026509 [Hibiscus sabdariffa]|uniref:Uncharacterized protein n=1 Tax=Hibiscus sabdariffa TaxID=183260 RepID=A0ABR2DRZ4_9ROSI
MRVTIAFSVKYIRDRRKVEASAKNRNVVHEPANNGGGFDDLRVIGSPFEGFGGYDIAHADERRDSKYGIAGGRQCIVSKLLEYRALKLIFM